MNQSQRQGHQRMLKLRQIMLGLTIFLGLTWTTSGCDNDEPDLMQTPSAPTVVPVQGSQADPESEPPLDWIMGLDLSYVTWVEERGGVYRTAAGNPEDIFKIMQGYEEIDLIRLRVWVEPPEAYGGLNDVLALAKRADAAGFDLLIDFHLSDFWADPSEQNKPKAWEDLEFEALTDAVYEHTFATINALVEQGTPPAVVQIGNEIDNGMLWPEGQVGFRNADVERQQWEQLAELLDAGVRGVRDARSEAQIMIHIAEGGDRENERGRWFFDHLTETGIEYDLIGLSYYPHWHGDLDILAFNIRDLVERTGKPVIVVETSYMWSLEWSDQTRNVMGRSWQLHTGFPATPEGQRDFLQAVVDTTEAAGGSGVVYWGGEWIAADPGDRNGSVWENQALFDFDGRVLPAMEVFRPDLLD